MRRNTFFEDFKKALWLAIKIVSLILIALAGLYFLITFLFMSISILAQLMWDISVEHDYNVIGNLVEYIGLFMKGA